MNLKETTHEMANCLKKGIQAERVWLFGSQARGDARADSDIDLLAIVPPLIHFALPEGGRGPARTQ